LPWQRTLRRPLPERITFHLPRPVIATFEIRKDEIRLGCLDRGDEG
jgi:hypothetical protein